LAGVLTEIYLCGVCSRHEILRRNGRGQDQLRATPALTDLSDAALSAHSSLSLDLGKWPKGTAAQSELWVKFKMPAAATEMGLKLMVCADADYDPNATDKGYDCRKPLLAFVKFTPPPAANRVTATAATSPWSVTVGVKPPPGPPPPPPPPGSAPCYNFHKNGTDCVFMANTDIRGHPGDLPITGGGGGHLNGSSGAEGNAKECQRMCENTTGCASWVFFVHSYSICTGPPANRTCRPDKTPGAGACMFRPSNSGCPSTGQKGQKIWAGARLSALAKDGLCGTHDGASAGVVSTLQLLPTDEEIDIRVFYDHDFAEIFFMQGRVVMSLGKKQQSALVTVDNGGFSAYTTSSPVVVSKANAWSVGSIWVSKASVLEQHARSLVESETTKQ
jgi:hypothetical protein